MIVYSFHWSDKRLSNCADSNDSTFGGACAPPGVQPLQRATRTALVAILDEQHLNDASGLICSKT